jgi:hypothetical protein
VKLFSWSIAVHSRHRRIWVIRKNKIAAVVSMRPIFNER